MASAPGNLPPKKPWEQAGGSSGPTPFNPPSTGSTSEVVEASGTSRPGEFVSPTDSNAIANRNPAGRPVPSRPWTSNYGNPGSTLGGYGSTMNYGGGMGYGSGMYGSSYGGYGGGMYGNSMYRSPYGGGMYGGGMYGGGMYGGGSMYGSGYGMGMGTGMGMGMGMGMGPPGSQDPNNPFGGPSSPPSFWMSLMRVMHGVVEFFGRIAFLIDQNTFAFHAFMSALLQLFDRSGMLYGELARFVLRLLGIRTRANKNMQQQQAGGLIGPAGPLPIEGPKAEGGSWDNVWGIDAPNS